MSSGYKVNKPYPEVKIDCQNPYWASILHDDYAAKTSEYTAISQYVYAHIKSCNKKVADDFLGIAIVEMDHLERLGDVINGLGGNPVFTDGCCNIWNSSFVPYGCCTEDRLRIAIQSEYEAINQYKNHICRICNDDIRKLLERIILDEELHIEIFKKDLYKYYK